MRQDAVELWDATKDRPDIFNIRELAKDLLQNGYGKKDADRYLISQDEMAQMIIQQFVAQIGKANPQLGGALAQFITQPNSQQFNQQSAETNGLPPNEVTEPTTTQPVV